MLFFRVFQPMQMGTCRNIRVNPAAPMRLSSIQSTFHRLNVKTWWTWHNSARCVYMDFSCVLYLWSIQRSFLNNESVKCFKCLQNETRNITWPIFEMWDSARSCDSLWRWGRNSEPANNYTASASNMIFVRISGRISNTHTWFCPLENFQFNVI